MKPTAKTEAYATPAHYRNGQGIFLCFDKFYPKPHKESILRRLPISKKDENIRTFASSRTANVLFLYMYIQKHDNERSVRKD